MNRRLDKFLGWLAWLFILLTVMYLGAHVLAYIIIHQQR